MLKVSIPKRVTDSSKIASYFVGSIATIFTILGYSLKDIMPASTFCIRIAAIIIVFIIILVIVYKYICKDYVNLKIRNNNVEICFGNIFKTEGYKVIACDSTFSTQVDDIVISQKSIHGQFLLEHAVIPELEQVITNDSVGLSRNFETGKIIRYHSNRDDETYLLLAFTKLNEQNEAHTNMTEFIQTLMRMWKGINSVYNSHDIILPLLGTGITRFDDGSKSQRELIACMLYTLYFSGLTFNSRIKIVMKEDSNTIPLYEYKNILQIITD